MDGKRFDNLTKSFATPRTRRGVLKTLGAGIAGGLVALGIGQTGAAPGGQGKGKGSTCGGPGHSCKWNRQCCGFAELVCMDGACSECPGNYCTATGSCAPACTDAQFYDAETCACTCPPVTCPSGWTFNQETCSCECSSGNICEATGSCDPSCPEDKPFDTYHCTCGWPV